MSIPTPSYYIAREGEATARLLHSVVGNQTYWLEKPSGYLRCARAQIANATAPQKDRARISEAPARAMMGYMNANAPQPQGSTT
jgi:hypothetical protein